MTKALAVVRTLFLVFIVGFAVRAMPWWSAVARTFDEQYARCANALSPLQRAVWLAIAWIALEVVIGWLVVWRSSHAARSQLKRELKEAKSAAQPPPPAGA